MYQLVFGTRWEGEDQRCKAVNPTYTNANFCEEIIRNSSRFVGKNCKAAQNAHAKRLNKKIACNTVNTSIAFCYC